MRRHFPANQLSRRFQRHAASDYPHHLSAAHEILTNELGLDRDAEIRGSDLFEPKVDHHVLGDLAPLGGPVLEPVEPRLQFGQSAFKALYKRFVVQG